MSPGFRRALAVVAPEQAAEVDVTPRSLRGLLDELLASLPDPVARSTDPSTLQTGLVRLVLGLDADELDAGSAAHPDWLRRHGSPKAVAALEDARRCESSPGAAYQSLLELRLRRLEEPAVFVPETGTWVLLDEILREPPRTRSKWLQRKAGLSKSSVSILAEPLANAATDMAICTALIEGAGCGPARQRGALVVDTSARRRRTGAHYTPESLAQAVVERALEPLVADRSPREILDLRICDPAMGDGAFLLSAAKFLVTRLARALEEEGGGGRGGTRTDEGMLFLEVVTRCLYGVDRDPIAVELARRALEQAVQGRLTAQPGRETGARSALRAHLASGDALVGTVRSGRLVGPTPLPPFDWHLRFADVFEPLRNGFDAVIGNPPWVAYAGRAAQPLPAELFTYYRTTSPAFAGYRSLHGLFAYRAAELLRDGGRLGLLLPTSIADLAGYAPARAAHDHLCAVDPELLDFGDGAFEGVFQPCMALTSTRRVTRSGVSIGGQRWLPGMAPAATGTDEKEAPAASASTSTSAHWPLARPDLDETSTRLLHRLEGLPRFSAETFGERGFQTTANDLAHLRRLEHAQPPFIVPLREGSDVSELLLVAPSHFADPTKLEGRLRSPEDFAKVAIVIRQTARYPIAALSDGSPFRNSLLAAFESEQWPRHALVLYLNSTAIRWYHFTRHRDARQGMPQLKIGHLRALPTVTDERARGALGALGRAERPAGPLSAHAREAVDQCVFDALGFTAVERDIALTWHRAHPLPVRRAASRRARTPSR